MHIVTDITTVGKKIRVQLDDSEVFQLYKGEAKKFGIAICNEISEDTYSEIYDTLKKRARERTLYLLKDMDKTEKQLRDKLKQSDYPDEIIDSTINFLKKYDYVNDARYVRLYLNLKNGSKSLRQIEMDLLKKGISKDTIRTVINESEFSDDEALECMIVKKIKDCDLSDKKQLSKVYRYLISKGFNYEQISEKMSAYIYEE